VEAHTLKKILLYSAVAVVLGLSLILVPLITLVEIRAENGYLAGTRSLPEQLEELEGTHGLDTPEYSTYDVKILAFSFVIALVAYMLFKRRTSRQDYLWSGRSPY
jgi:ABC-type dipeptide/oligopeptide/nickel transport system permease component